MWQQTYTPIGNSLPLSALFAAIPIFTLLLLLGVLRKPAWMASLAGLGAAAIVAAGVYGMPLGLLGSTVVYGAAFVVVKPGHALEQAALCEFLQQRIAKFKMPRRFRFSDTALPKTGTGKIIKRELREMFWKGKEKRIQG
jgi:acyl-CoA synthetase (AMP-forming)/AMP-acid ligase II